MIFCFLPFILGCQFRSFEVKRTEPQKPNISEKANQQQSPEDIMMPKDFLRGLFFSFFFDILWFSWFGSFDWSFDRKGHNPKKNKSKNQKRSEEHIMPEDFPQRLLFLDLLGGYLEIFRGFPRYLDSKTSWQGSCIARHCFEHQD